MIIWAGVRSEDVGMIVEHYPSVILPTRKMEVQKVPGRSKDVILFQDAYENYEQSYQVFLDAKYKGGLTKIIPAVSDWLLGHDGYQKLEDSYFPDVYRLAYYTGGTEFISYFNEYGEGTLTFNCAPEKYFKVGYRPITLTNGQVISNPTGFKAMPLLRIRGGSKAVVTLTFQELDEQTLEPIENPGRKMIINPLKSGIMIDTRDHFAYNAADPPGPSDRNSTITGYFEDMYLHGKTKITWSTTGTAADYRVNEVTIWARWWTL